MSIKVVIIDDEVLAQNIIKNYLSKLDDFEILKTCSNGFEGLKAIQELKPDIVFLDIQMPKLTGFEMLELVENPPCIIFSTAYDEFALKAFEVNAIDYLLKPYSFERFIEALNKAQKFVSSEIRENKVENLINHLSNEIKQINRVVVKQNGKVVIIPSEEIKVIEAADDYVWLHTTIGKYIKEKTMKFFEEHLSSDDFIRIHRSYIVKVSNIKQFEAAEKDSYTLFTYDNQKLPMSKTGFQKLRQILNF
jgi:two-component system LytT family response regulator